MDSSCSGDDFTDVSLPSIRAISSKIPFPVHVAVMKPSQLHVQEMVFPISLALVTWFLMYFICRTLDHDDACIIILSCVVRSLDHK